MHDEAGKPISNPAQLPAPGTATKSWVMGLFAVMKREPVLFVTLGYLVVSFIGLWASYWFYRRFGVPILEYMQGSDFLIAGLREPLYALALAAAFAFSWVVMWPERWRRRHPERAEALRASHWWARVVFPGRAFYWSWWGMTPEGGLVFGVFWVMIWMVMAFVSGKAQGVYDGGGHVVRVTLSGASDALPGEARLLGTTSGFVFLWWPEARRAEAVSLENIGRIQSLRGPRAVTDKGKPAKDSAQKSR